MPGQEKIVREYYEKNPSAIDAIRGSIYEEKILNLIKKEASVNKKEISKNEAEKILKEENEKNAREGANLAKHSHVHDHNHDHENDKKKESKKALQTKKKPSIKAKPEPKKTKSLKKVSKK